MEKQFEEWALVELFGHNKLAGKVSEMKFGNQSMLRVDVPQIGSVPAFTKIVNVSSIYAINPMTEADAIDYAKNLKASPIDVFDMRQIFNARIAELKQNGTLIEAPKQEFGEFDKD